MWSITADWNAEVDLNKDTKVALIGAGSSGIQLLPAIKPIVG